MQNIAVYFKGFGFFFLVWFGLLLFFVDVVVVVFSFFFFPFFFLTKRIKLLKVHTVRWAVRVC